MKSGVKRREESNEKIMKLGIECFPELPIIEEAKDVKLKSVDDICKRAIASLLSIQLACDIIEGNNYEESRDYFITFLRQCGLTLEQIRAYLSANIELDTQLTYCQNVYCKVARAIMPITLGDITITAEMVEQAFKRKNGEE